MNKKEQKNEFSRKKTGKTAGGFTFVETLAVLAIGAILSAGSIVSATKVIAMAKRTSSKSQISQYCSALQTYFLDCGQTPPPAPSETPAEPPRRPSGLLSRASSLKS